MTDAQFSFLVGEVIKEIRGRIESKGKEYARGQTMTKTTCPTCGSKCIYYATNSCSSSACHNREHYKVLPQPDLTKLREAYKSLCAVRDNSNCAGLQRFNEINKAHGNVLMAVWELLEEKEIKEVLDVETSNS